MDRFDHKCSEIACCCYGQRTYRSCNCHKTREEVMLEYIAKLENKASLGLRVIEPEERHQGAILIADRDGNDVAEFFHNEYATVGQSYETALQYARYLTEPVEIQ